MRINKQFCFDTKKGAVHAFLLENAQGMQVELLDLGCTIRKILVPDKDGKLIDVCLGFQNYQDYEINSPCYFGATVGRCANRIAAGRFMWQGKPYQVERNAGANHIHGGSTGFWNRIWEQVTESSSQIDTAFEADELAFRLFSPDGDGGYPGNLTVRVAFALNDDNCLEINYRLESSDIAFANLTNHAYFNLNGEGKGDILDHILQIEANQFTETDAESIPTGRLLSLENTPLDFHQPKRIGRDIEEDYEPLRLAGGYDHNYILDQNAEFQAKAYSEESGIEMIMHTNCPGVQLYTGNYLNGTVLGKCGAYYEKRSGFCLETQYFPDSPNHPAFPQPIVKKGQPLLLKTSYCFTIHE